MKRKISFCFYSFLGLCSLTIFSACGNKKSNSTDDSSITSFSESTTIESSSFSLSESVIETISNFSTEEEIIDESSFNICANEGLLVSIDGVNYKNELDEVDIFKSMLVSYGDGTYKIDNNSNLLKLDSSNNYVVLSDEELNTEINKLLNDIIFYPISTKNGRDFITLNDAYYTALSGYFIEFGFYIIAPSNEDNFIYDIYLNGYDDDNTISTSITSNPTSVKLNKGLTTIENGNVVTYNEGDDLEFYITNTLRMSSTSYYFDSTLNDYIIDESSSLIYEINDTLNGNKDRGSYATDNTEILKYNANYNAMFTYYNKLVSLERQLKPLSYDDLPKNIINQLPTNDSSLLESVENASDADSSHYKKMATVSTNNPVYVIFRIWLEGWDADNIDIIGNDFKFALAFSRKQIN